MTYKWRIFNQWIQRNERGWNDVLPRQHSGDVPIGSDAGQPAAGARVLPQSNQPWWSLPSQVSRTSWSAKQTVSNDLPTFSGYTRACGGWRTTHGAWSAVKWWWWPCRMCSTYSSVPLIQWTAIKHGNNNWFAILCHFFLPFFCHSLPFFFAILCYS